MHSLHVSSCLPMHIITVQSFVMRTSWHWNAFNIIGRRLWPMDFLRKGRECPHLRPLSTTLVPVTKCDYWKLDLINTCQSTLQVLVIKSQPFGVTLCLKFPPSHPHPHPRPLPPRSPPPPPPPPQRLAPLLKTVWANPYIFETKKEQVWEIC